LRVVLVFILLGPVAVAVVTPLIETIILEAAIVILVVVVVLMVVPGTSRGSRT